MASSLHFSRFTRTFDFTQYKNLCRGPILAAVATTILLPVAIRDYSIYKSYGPGGLPYNLVGWLITNLLRLLSREQLSTDPYHDSDLHFVSEGGGLLPPGFPCRESARPKIGPHPIPQRQLSQLPSVEMREKLLARFHTLGSAAQERGLVEIKQSLYERQHSAFSSRKRLTGILLLSKLAVKSHTSMPERTEVSMLFCIPAIARPSCQKDGASVMLCPVCP
jgi:hypothetical protein